MRESGYTGSMPVVLPRRLKRAPEALPTCTCFEGMRSLLGLMACGHMKRETITCTTRDFQNVFQPQRKPSCSFHALPNRFGLKSKRLLWWCERTHLWQVVRSIELYFLEEIQRLFGLTLIRVLFCAFWHVRKLISVEERQVSKTSCKFFFQEVLIWYIKDLTPTAFSSCCKRK